LEDSTRLSLFPFAIPLEREPAWANDVLVHSSRLSGVTKNLRRPRRKSLAGGGKKSLDEQTKKKEGRDRALGSELSNVLLLQFPVSSLARYKTEVSESLFGEFLLASRKMNSECRSERMLFSL